MSQQVLSLSSEKDTLTKHLELRNDQLPTEVLRRKVLEDDLDWVLQKRVDRMVDRILDSSEFALEIRCVKVTCVAAGIESGA